MRRRLSAHRVGLLVVALLALGLVSCERAAPEREGETVEPGETSVATTPVAGVGTPVPGETVVSAVTPSAGTAVTGVQPTTAPAGGTPSAPGPQATALPAPTSAGSAAPSPVPPPAGGAYLIHTVQPGESLSGIAQRYGTTWQAIAAANGLVNPNQIYAGQQLKIPTTSSSGGTSGGSTGCRIRHTVQQGEWVWQIARHYGVDPNTILAANGLTVQSANLLYPGTVLCIP